VAVVLAQQQDIEYLTESHWRVVDSLRDYYLDFGIPLPLLSCAKTRDLISGVSRSYSPMGLLKAPADMPVYRESQFGHSFCIRDKFHGTRGGGVS